MKKLVGLFGLLALFITPVLAQDNPAPPPDQEQAPTAPTAPSEPVKKVKQTFPVSKFELSGGFTYRSYYGAGGATTGMKGEFVSFDYNRYRWIGLEGEVLGVTGTLDLRKLELPEENINVFTAMGGPKIYPLGHHKITPYGHVLYGVGILATAVPAFAGYGGNTTATAVRGWEAGGGLDYNRWAHWGIRLIQLDYSLVKFLGPSIQGQGSVRVSVGFVYRFGER